jgi:hypothetical protein
MVGGGKDGSSFCIEIKILGGQFWSRGCFCTNPREDFLRLVTNCGVARDGSQTALAKARGFRLQAGEVTLHVDGDFI